MNNSESLLDFTTDKKTIKKSAVNSVIIQLLFKLKGIITMPIITYYLLPSEMGVFNLISVTAAMLTPLFSMNLTDGPAILLVQEKCKVRIVAMYNTVINGTMLFCLFFAVIFLLAMNFSGSSYYQHAFLILLLIFSTIAYKLVSYILAVFQKTSLLVRNTLLKDVTATILSVAFVVAGYSFLGMIYALIITNIAAGILIYRVTRKDLPYSLSIDREILITFLKTSLPLLPVFFFSWVIQSSDSYFLAYFKGDGAVGKYSVIYGITNVILSLTYALNFFWFPVSAKLWVDNREQYRKAFISVFVGFVTALLLAVAAFELNAKLVMQLFVRRSEYQDAYVIMGVIAFAFAMQVLITLLTAPLYSNRNIKTIFSCYLVGGGVNTLINIILIPKTGIIGAAISTSVSYLIIVALMAYCTYRMADFAFIDSRLKYIIGIFIFSWLGIAWLRELIPVYQVLVADVFLLIATGTLIYFKGMTEEERQYVDSAYGEFKLKMEKKA